MDEKQVYDFVAQCISESGGVEISDIRPESTLFLDLGLTSIDMVEVFYLIEMEYEISLKVSDLDKDIREKLQGDVYEVDNVITEKGLEALKENLPEINAGELKEGLTINQLMNLITVASLVKMVYTKINES